MKLADLLPGLQLIRDAEPDAQIAVGFEVIYAGSYQKSSGQMTEDELAEMKEMGWSNRYESWCHYV